MIKAFILYALGFISGLLAMFIPYNWWFLFLIPELIFLAWGGIVYEKGKRLS